MKSTFDVKLDYEGYHGIDIHNEDLIKSKDGVDNPFAYNYCMNQILRTLVRMQFCDDDKFAVDMLRELDKRNEELMEKYKISCDKYGIQD